MIACHYSGAIKKTDKVFFPDDFQSGDNFLQMTRSSVKLTPVATKAAIYEKSDTELMTSQAHGTLDPSGSLINLRWLSKKEHQVFLF